MSIAARLAFCALALCLALAARGQTPNYSDIWWNPAESGWGIQVAHSGTTLFATWYTYDESNRQTFLILADGQFTAANVWSGNIYKPTGAPYSLIPYDPTRYRANSAIGTATLTFSGANAATLRYTVSGATLTRNIERFPFSGATSGNYPNDLTDLYYNAQQNGWGVSLAQRGSAGLFGVIYHYDTDGAPLFFIMTDVSVSGGSWRGNLYRAASTASNFLSTTWTSASISTSLIGTFDLTVAGDGFSLRWTANGITQTTAMARLLTKPTTGSGGDAAACLPDLLLTAGSTWRYTYFTAAANTRSTSTGKSNGPAMFNAQAANEYESTTTATASGITSNTRTRSYARRDGLDILTLGAIVDTTFSGAPVPIPGSSLTSVLTPALIARYSLKAGESFTQSYTNTTTGSASSTTTTRLTTTFVGTESVTVPAGTFQACRWQDESASGSSTTRITRWEVKEVGTVKQRDENQGVDTVLESATVNGRNYP
jgi:hypothetical protein